MKAKHLLFTLLVFQAGMSRAQVFPDDYWGYVNTLQDEWLRQICTVGLDTVYIVGEDGLIARSTDRGDTWDKQHCTQAHLNDVAFFDAHTGLAAGEGGTILRTTDAGATWLPQASGTTETINALAFVDADHAWAVGTNSLVLHSADGGATWEKRDIVDIECTLNDIAFRGDLGYMVGDYGMVYKTEDAGKNWQRQEILENPGMGDALNSLNIMENKTYMLWENQHIYFSEEQEEWQICPFSGGYPLDISFFDDKTGFCIDGNIATVFVLGIRKTEDGGTNWNLEPIDKSASEAISISKTQIHVVSEKMGYVLIGNALLRKPAPSFSTVGINSISKKVIMQQDATHNLIISTSTGVVSNISVFDSKGIGLATRTITDNHSSHTIETASFAPGIYFLHIFFSDNTETTIKWIKR